MTSAIITVLATVSANVPDNAVGTGFLLGATILSMGVALRYVKNRKK